MKRSELLKSKGYWLADIQIKLFNQIEEYCTIRKINKTQLAEELGVSKGYISQILNGDFDHKISKLVELALAFNKVPVISFVDLDKYINKDADKPKKLNNPNVRARVRAARQIRNKA